MALNLIAEVMGWEEAETSPANREYAWLKLMSSIKYDGYADFRAGVRFIESLAVWLKQFDKSDRPIAYEFFKRRLVYVSPAELQCLIEIFVPEVVTPHLRKVVAQQLGIKPYEVWATRLGMEAFTNRLRSTLFIGMSDGSRMDILRRANIGKLNQEQVITTLTVDDEKWRSLGGKLRKALGADAKFDSVYLIEDFTGSGTTFIRQDEKGEWDGKLAKFNRAVGIAKDELGAEFPLAENFALHIHHYISTDQARVSLDERIDFAHDNWKDKVFGSVSVTEGIRLPASLKLNRETDGAMLDLCDRYHDPGLDKRLEEHLKASGILTVKHGFASCALPLIMDHNTPNNSIPLLWAETEAERGHHSMQPLFRRRDRHG
ncbi:hypothetical protein A6U91_20930 [Agrobacterium tumefaciens]|uniref:PRTase-CE domain-containing protein n=2 Tax=Agrobacterium tumefaciens TaxID=358 RepID=A0AB36EBW9_AGRTU|nr:hypothetical protein A6U91_20930 [Agrobacterium tumefaciens]